MDNQSYYVEHHSDMDAADEFLAKYILEDVCHLGPFNKSECPDLHADGFGVEVTDACDGWYRKSEGAYEKSRIAGLSGDDEKAKRCREKSVVPNVYIGDALSHLCASVGFEDTPFGPVRIGFASGDLYGARKPLLKFALEEKLQKLNSGNYVDFPVYGLFMRSLIDLRGSDRDAKKKCVDLAKYLSGVQSEVLSANVGWRGFDKVFVYSNSGALLFVLDMKTCGYECFDVETSRYTKALSQLSRTVK